MPSQYGYNIDSYGAVSMTTTDDNNKVQQQLKEERSKESPSPNEHSSKLGQQQVCSFFLLNFIFMHRRPFHEFIFIFKQFFFSHRC